MENIVITGGCGFIGANLVRFLNSGNHFNITVFDNLTRGQVEFLKDSGPFNLVKGDIRDKIALNKAFSNADAVIHLAAYGSVVESVQDPQENYFINVEGTFNVLNSCRDAGIKKVVFASTGGALIGNAEPPVDEGSVPRPISPYGASKLAGEAYCSAFAASYNMDITSLRFANVIGPISWHKKGAITAFFKNIMTGEPIKIFGDGSATRDFLYVKDLCTGIFSAFISNRKGFNVYHLASGREVSVLKLANLIKAVTGKEDHQIIFNEKRAGEVERNFAAFDLAQQELDFVPKYSLEQGLELTWKWFKNKTV